MKTFHNEAEEGQIGKAVLMPGDPLRARYIAETYLTDVVCYNKVRGMNGYTGYYEGKKISVQGSGMGIPSMGIYAYELYHTYGVNAIIRVGTAGAIREEVAVGDIIMAMGCCTNSNFASQYHLPGSFAPIADFGLLKAAADEAEKVKAPYHVGNVLSSDVFYEDQQGEKAQWAKMGVLVQEMETLSLYTTAARAGKKALSILTAGSSLHSDRALTNEEREQKLDMMIRCALHVALWKAEE
ncbi:purine-nucleoside phosphorylase [Lacrimispora sp.]|uniref:purine-nucleoside phosphorylase n=1 Tax=Lacrimispora sp. TaxID=2719234 RepID=UPI002FD9358A